MDTTFTQKQLPEIKLVGISTRTNKNYEENPSTNEIAKTIQKYLKDKLSDKIKNRINPETTFCVTTNYEKDDNGEFTFFVGEQVNSFDGNEEFGELTIPSQTYVKFTNKPGPMPNVYNDMWQDISKITNLGGIRSYIADFEVYDERSKDFDNVKFDIFIGIKN